MCEVLIVGGRALGTNPWSPQPMEPHDIIAEGTTEDFSTGANFRGMNVVLFDT